MFKSSFFLMVSFVALCTVLSSFLFSANISSSRFTSITKLIKNHIGGQVINHTDHPITVYEWRFPHILAPGQRSHELLIRDIDAIKIEGPTLIKAKLYHSGILKFCDTASIIVTNTNYQGQPVKKFRLNGASNLCQLLGDFQIYQKIQDAMPINR